MKQTAASRPKRIPKLRFPEFQDAPEWELKRFGDLGKFTGGGTPSKANDSYWSGNIPWVSSSDISEESIYDITITRFITEDAIKETATKLVPANSILLISRVGVGKLAITRKQVCTSQDFTNFTPNKVHLVFLAYLLKSHKDTLLSFNQGTSIKGFTKENIANFEPCLPSLPEQQRIADCLSSLDEWIAAEAKRLDALKDHKKGLMQQLFPAEGETTPKLRFPEFQDAPEWEVKKLGKIASVVASGDLDKNHYSPNNTDKHTHPVYSNAIEREGLYGYYSSFRYPEDSVTITARGTLGVAFLRKAKFMGIGRLLVVNELKKCVPYFIKECWNHCVVVHIETTSIPQLTAIAARQMTLPIPPSLAEQQRIADCLSSLDELIAAQSKRLDALCDHKKGLMQQLFPSGEEADV